MKNKKLTKIIAVFAVLLAAILIFAACSSATGGDSKQENGSIVPPDSQNDNALEGNGSSNGQPEATEETKIIYTVHMDIDTVDLDKTIAVIRGAMKSDERTDKEYLLSGSGYASFTLRIKSDRLDEFIAAMAEGGKISSYNKTARDISIEYYFNESKIEILETEMASLIRILEKTDDIQAIISINTRISQIEGELARINTSQKKYDSLVDYSEVYITIRYVATYEPEPEPTTGEKIASIFGGAWKALGKVFEWLLYALIAVFPFALVAAIVIGIIILIKYLKAKKAGIPFTLRRTRKNGRSARPQTAEAPAQPVYYAPVQPQPTIDTPPETI
ncbi:MAG: DUF4349 domain-containing protein [Clostridiaceae bacterium]|jgi:hypothetical protein|nr:DUF4349 domain-containing protein [Clostridiaceae bacterium]